MVTSSKGCRHLNLALLLNVLYPVPWSPDTGARAECQGGTRAGWCHIPALLFGSSPCIPATSLPRKGLTVNPGLVCRQKHVCRHTNAHAGCHVRHVRRARQAWRCWSVLCLLSIQYTATWSVAQGKWETCPRWDELTLQLFLILGVDKWH